MLDYIPHAQTCAHAFLYDKYPETLLYIKLYTHVVFVIFYGPLTCQILSVIYDVLLVKPIITQSQWYIIRPL